VDVCVANSSDHEFPKNEKAQCFLHGFDFSGLSVKWVSGRDVEVAFDNGRVSLVKRLRRFLVRDDAEYDALVQKYQARTLAGKLFYLFMHLLPGLLAYVLINIFLVHAAAVRLTGLSDPIFQGTCLVGFVFVWHLVVPLAILRWVDHLSFRDSLAFLSLHEFDGKGFFLVMPVVFVVYTLLSPVCTSVIIWQAWTWSELESSSLSQTGSSSTRQSSAH